MNPARENILRRVRQALRSPAPPPPAAAAPSEPLFPAVSDPATRFCEEFTALKGELVSDLPAFLAEFPRIASDGTIPGNASVRAADLGVSGCECLIAETGSIVVSTRSAGGRALSVLPPVHLVIARRDQLVPDLAGALDRLQTQFGKRWPSLVTVISGPSRTADIEKILVLGAHGPKRLALHFLG